MNVAVVGGGIVGLASAYYLAERGADVTLFEKGSLGSGSSERSAGGIRAQFSTAVNVDLSLASMAVWEEFEETFGTDIEYRRSGYLFLARDDETASAFEEQVAMQNERGVPSELLGPEEATDHCPELRSEEFVAATYSPTDGFADPHLALQGFAEAARKSGVEIRTKTEVTEIHRDGDRVTGLTANGQQATRQRADGQRADDQQADDQREEYDFVVNAAGPWARQVAELAGIEVPVTPERRQVLVVDPGTPVPESVPLTIDLDTGSYFRPEREGAALVGGHFSGPVSDAHPDRYRQKIDLDWAAEAIERASDCADYFGPDSQIRRGWAGLYAVTPDHHPIIEETIPGLVNAVGFSGHGFQHAPATGQLVAELVLDGEAGLVDISSLGSERFEEGELVEEKNVA